MPRITACSLIKILKGYQTCDQDRLATIANHLGVTTEYLMDGYLTKNVTQDDIDAVEKAIEFTKEEHTEAATDTIVRSLRTTEADSSSLITIPHDIYKKLAQLTSAYSHHHHTKTVYFRNNALEIKPEDGCQDSSKDTYEDNGIVAKNYINLIEAIVRIARDEGEESPIFSILAKLYQCLTTLSSSSCNQKNAAEFARSLEEHAPSSLPNSGNSQEEDSSQNDEEATASDDQAHNHSNDTDEGSTKETQNSNNELKEVELTIPTILPYYKEELLSTERTEYYRSMEEIAKASEEQHAYILYEDADNHTNIEIDMYYITKAELNPFASLQLELTDAIKIPIDYYSY